MAFRGVDFRTDVQSLGRNGVMKTVGITATCGTSDKTTMIEPINSRRCAGRCWIEIPNDQLREVAAMLIAIAEGN